MSYAPKIDVLTRQPSVLEAPDLSWEALVEHFPGLAAADAVCLTGSVEAGWGNPYSDIDLYAFSDSGLELPDDESVELWPDSDASGVKWMRWMGRYGDTCVDLAVWPLNSVETLLQPYVAAEEPEFCIGVSDAMRDFLYRVSIGRALKGHEQMAELQESLERSSYPRALARLLKVMAENALIDVAGQLEANDVLSARAAAMLAARHATDSCLVLAGDLCRNEKWLLRRLERTQDSGLTPGEYKAQVLDGPRAGEDDAACALRIARWAQAQLVSVEPRALATAAD
jgi:hypothetical protein